MSIAVFGSVLVVIGLLTMLIINKSAGIAILTAGALLIYFGLRRQKQLAAKSEAAYIDQVRERQRQLAAKNTYKPAAAAESPQNELFYLHTSRDTEKNIAQLKDHFVVVDTETTGDNSSTDRMVSLAAIKYHNGVETERFYTLIYPERSIPLDASEINGIFDQTVAGAPKESEVMPKFAEFVGDAMTGKTLFVAYNAPFDMKFIKNAMERCGIAGNVRSFDVLWYAKKRIKELKNYKQTTVAKHLRIDTDGAHQADCDCEMCAKILMELLKDA